MAQETLRGDLGEYRIFELVAAGGFGSVFYGRDLDHNVPVAVKRLHAHLTDQPGFVERFEREAEMVRGLEHPNLVRLLDQGRDEHGVPFLVLEWVEGLTVGDWLKRRGAYQPSEAADVAAQALEGLQAAWERSVVHRDIKPANLMVTPSGRVKVMDFGVAKDVDLATMAGTAGVIGTPAYMAPEQLNGQPLDCRADIYSLGVTLYQMIAGSPPFQGPNMTDFFRQHLRDEPPPLEVVCPGVDRALVAVIERALAKDPDDRFSTPAEMMLALQPHAAAGWETAWSPRPGTPAFGSPSTPHSYPSVPPPRQTSPPLSSETEAVARTMRAPSSASVAAPNAPARRGFPVYSVLAPLLVIVGGVAFAAWYMFLGPAAPAQPPAATPVPAGSVARPSPTPSSGSTAIFNDSLDDASKGRLLKSSTDPSVFIVLYDGDHYVIQKINPTSQAIASVPIPAPAGVTYDDSVVAVDARVVDPTPNRFVALTCRDRDAQAGYVLSAAPGAGKVTLSRLDNGVLTPLESASSEALRKGDDMNHFELTCVGPMISAKVNDVDVLAIQDPTYARGGLRIGAGSDASGPRTVEAHFRNLSAVRLSNAR
jgi:serine/threonine-protein kinase